METVIVSLHEALMLWVAHMWPLVTSLRLRAGSAKHSRPQPVPVKMEVRTLLQDHFTAGSAELIGFISTRLQTT